MIRTAADRRVVAHRLRMTLDAAEGCADNSRIIDVAVVLAGAHRVAACHVVSVASRTGSGKSFSVRMASYAVGVVGRLVIRIGLAGRIVSVHGC